MTSLSRVGVASGQQHGPEQVTGGLPFWGEGPCYLPAAALQTVSLRRSVPFDHHEGCPSPREGQEDARHHAVCSPPTGHPKEGPSVGQFPPTPGETGQAWALPDSGHTSRPPRSLDLPRGLPAGLARASARRAA